MKEKVLVTPAYAVEGWFKDTNFVKERIEDKLGAALFYGMYPDREEAEKNPDWKQIIPYCILYKDVAGYNIESDSRQYVYAYQRTKKAGENRLHDKWSLGIGGHINPVDGETSCVGVYNAALKREIKEEVGYDLVTIPPIIGMIYDNSNDVGKVHIGFVHLVNVPQDFEVVSDDPSISNGSWTGPYTRHTIGEKFENWSKLVIENVKLPGE